MRGMMKSEEQKITIKQLTDDQKMSEVIALCKRRGFIFQGSEIYGGINGFWDYGPAGVSLKRNIADFWWEDVVNKRGDIVGLDSAIIMHPKVWEASGHVESFTDPMVDCKKCKRRFKADNLETEICPECGGELTEARLFNLMFRTNVGATTDSQSVTYLRPETAQSIFINFKNVLASSRVKIPFGIAQMGKSFRNEVNPRNFIFRSREFEQMEMEYFISPHDDTDWLNYWVEERFKWYVDLGIKKENLRLRPHEPDELAHYAKACVDVEYRFPFGWQELEGIADRGDFDLSQHIKYSGKDLSFFDEQTKEKYIPEVVEISAGVDRTFLTVIVDAFRIEVLGNGEERVVAGLNPRIAPIQIAVFPLVRKLSEHAQRLEKDLGKKFHSFYDEKGAIGKLYRRQDEIGTPYCITFDFDSLEDNAVTVRDRDTMLQDRISIDQVTDYLQKRLI
jgi:glycyl-tRNA synthetase